MLLLSAQDVEEYGSLHDTSVWHLPGHVRGAQPVDAVPLPIIPVLPHSVGLASLGVPALYFSEMMSF